MNINLGSIESQAHQHYMRAPSISIVSYDHESVIFKVKNNSSGDSARVYYEIGDTTPDLYSQVLDPGETSSNITFTGLTAETTYTIYARTYYGGTYSSNATSSFTTVKATTDTPSITDYGYDAFFAQIYWKVQNLDSSSVTIYTEVGDSTPDENVIIDVASNAKTETQYYSTSVSGTIYAKAQASGEELSAYDSQYVST